MKSKTSNNRSDENATWFVYFHDKSHIIYTHIICVTAWKKKKLKHEWTAWRINEYYRQTGHFTDGIRWRSRVNMNALLNFLSRASTSNSLRSHNVHIRGHIYTIAASRRVENRRPKLLEHKLIRNADRILFPLRNCCRNTEITIKIIKHMELTTNNKRNDRNSIVIGKSISHLREFVFPWKDFT